MGALLGTRQEQKRFGIMGRAGSLENRRLPSLAEHYSARQRGGDVTSVPGRSGFQEPGAIEAPPLTKT